MRELPKLFNESGEFVEPDAATLATLSPDAVKALAAIRNAYNAVKEAEQKVEGSAQTTITDALTAQAAAQERVKPFGEYGFHRLWQQHVQGR